MQARKCERSFTLSVGAVVRNSSATGSRCIDKIFFNDFFLVLEGQQVPCLLTTGTGTSLSFQPPPVAFGGRRASHAVTTVTCSGGPGRRPSPPGRLVPGRGGLARVEQRASRFKLDRSPDSDVRRR